MFDTFEREHLSAGEWAHVSDASTYDYERQVWTTADHCHLDCTVEGFSPLYCGVSLALCPGQPDDEGAPLVV